MEPFVMHTGTFITFDRANIDTDATGDPLQGEALGRHNLGQPLQRLAGQVVLPPRQGEVVGELVDEADFFVRVAEVLRELIDLGLQLLHALGSRQLVDHQPGQSFERDRGNRRLPPRPLWRCCGSCSLFAVFMDTLACFRLCCWRWQCG